MKAGLLHIVLMLMLGLVMGCTDYGLKVERLDDNLYAILGEGGNSGVLICDSAVLVIDTKMKQGAERMRRWVEDKAPGRKVYIVNTHVHKDHNAGNHLYNNPVIIAGDCGEQFWNALSAREDMPNQWLTDTLVLYFGDEVVVITNVGQAHTFDDVTVFMKHRKVLFTGDIVLNEYHPFLDERAGSQVDNYISAQNYMLMQLNPQIVVPGHGQVGGPELIQDFRQYLVDMKDAASNPDHEVEAREKYFHYASIPINRAGFDLTLQYIRNSESLRE